jgi:RNA recognition motif-containing protein
MSGLHSINTIIRDAETKLASDMKRGSLIYSSQDRKLLGPIIPMNNKLFVGNLSFKISEGELEELFAQYGTVTSCSIPTDRDTGRKRGFAFIEMGSQEECEAAIRGLNGQDVAGRQIAVSIAQPKPKGGGGGGRRDF